MFSLIDLLPSPSDSLREARLKSASAIELSQMIMSPVSLEAKIDAMAEIARRGFGDERVFYLLEREVLADVSGLPDGSQKDDCIYARKIALWTIGLLHRPKGRQALPTSRVHGMDAIRLVLGNKREYVEVKLAAIQAIKVIDRPGDPMIRRILRKAENDKNVEVRKMASEALRDTPHP